MAPKMRWRARKGDCGPYGCALPGFDDGLHDFHQPELGEPDGLCPLCNNARHGEYDRRIIEGEDLWEVAKIAGVGYNTVERHAALHVWPIYAGAFKEVCGDEFLGKVPEGRYDAFGRLPTRAVIPRIPALLEERVKELYRHRLGRRAGSLPELSDRPARRYALDGKVAFRPLSAWDDTRMSEEIEVRTNEAINFYDEMMDIRKNAMQVFDEVMASGNLKYYSTAIAAVRERRGIVETLGKMSLIAKQLADETQGKKKLSPGMKSVVDSIYKLLPDEDDDEESDDDPS